MAFECRFPVKKLLTPRVQYGQYCTLLEQSDFRYFVLNLKKLRVKV